MINCKQISRKKSLQLLPSKEIYIQKGLLKTKKSTSNLNLFKTQSNKNQDKIQLKSHSKGKTQRSCENFNQLNFQNNHKKTQINKKITKNHQQYHEDTRHQTKTTNTQILVKSKSTSKIKSNNDKKKPQREVDLKLKEKSKIKKSTDQKMTSAKTDRLTHKKSVNSLVDKKKQTGQSKQKFKQKKKSVNKSKQKKPKLSKISEIIQRSILYSDYQIKQNELGNMIQEQKYYQSMGLNYHIQYISLQDSNCNFCCKYQSKEDMQKITSAAVTIQKHFRGYIQRKYIMEARYIIDCVKKIQRFWRNILKKKQKINNKNVEVSSSLITIKDLNDTYKEDKTKNQSESKEMMSCRQDLQTIVKNLLSEDGINQSLKQKIRSVIGKDNKCQQKQQKSFTKEQYAKKLIKQQIFSEKIFNSPMNLKQSNLLSPSLHNDFLSPKCFSSSQKKQKQAFHYAEYFKNSKVPLIVSPKKDYLINDENKNQFKNTSQYRKQFKSTSQDVSKQNCDVLNFKEQKKFLKQRLTEEEKSIVLSKSNKSIKNQIVQISKFSTSFNTIQQFCFLIIDFLRQNSQSTEVLIQKLKALKYQKIERVFKEWADIKSQQLSQDDNSQFQEMLMKEECQKPSIFSKYQRRIIIESPSIRLFLNQNNYSDDDISNTCSSHSAYIHFMFNVFEQAIFQSFKSYSLKNIFGCNKHYNQTDQDFLNNVLSEALGNILDSAQMLCGSFCEQNATEVQIQQKMLINRQRIEQLTHKIDQFDINSCEMWFKLQICENIFQDLVEESTYGIINGK